MSQTDRFASYPSLRERVVSISGGGSGIGACMVEHFALQGARVAFLDIGCESSETLARNLSRRCEHAPLFMPCDVRDVAALRAAIAEIEGRLGAVRVLVNNAASDDRHRFADVTPEYWDERMATNLRHHFFAIQAVVPRMAEAGGGSIVNMSSIAYSLSRSGYPPLVIPQVVNQYKEYRICKYASTTGSTLFFISLFDMTGTEASSGVLSHFT